MGDRGVTYLLLTSLATDNERRPLGLPICVLILAGRRVFPSEGDFYQN